MAKNPTEKTNGHSVDALKAVTPKKPARKAPAATATVKAAARPAPRTAAKTAVKTAAKTVARPAAKAPVKAGPKPAAKAAVQPAARPAPRASAKPAAGLPDKPPASAPVPAELADDGAVARDKARKPKLVRDSFTMPEQEYALLGQVKKACIKAGFDIKKSELLRIGVALISQLDMATLQSVLAGLPQLKTGRPKNE